MNVPNKAIRIALTIGLVIAAAAAAFYLYVDYIINPWTRDGQVRAYIITIAPRVAGNVAQVHVADNQFVKSGDPILEIDPSQYQLAVDSAQQALESARQEVASLEASIDAAKAAVTSAQATLDEANKELGRAKEAGDAVSKEFVDQQTAAAEVANAALSQSQAQLAQVTKE
ncbi:MAG: biotin/lipoyl-binding protein, partial [Pseudomonadota bacterium]